MVILVILGVFFATIMIGWIIRALMNPLQAGAQILIALLALLGLVGALFIALGIHGLTSTVPARTSDKITDQPIPELCIGAVLFVGSFFTASRLKRLRRRMINKEISRSQ